MNAADLRQESLYMRYRALSHETSLDPTKISAIHNFVADLEEHSDPLSLFQTLKRNVCSRILSHIRNPIKIHIDKPETPLPDESELGKKLSTAVQWFAPFVQKYPNEKNMELVDTFLETIELFRDHYPDSEHPANVAEQFRSVFTDIQKRQIEPIIGEYAEMYEGVLRRQELLGKPMPIWGADLSGKQMDPKALEGKVVLLDFWATWCGPCIAEFPHLKLLYQKYKDKGFEIVSFSVDSDQEKLQEYLVRNPLPWIMLSKESTEQAGLPPLSRYYGAKSLPVVLLRDRLGKTVLLDARGEKLDDALERLLTMP
jgi:thiol-disulfide isomerase/thioredoxin